MGRTACTESQCLYKGALYLTSVPYKGDLYLYLTSVSYKGDLYLYLTVY